MKLTTVIFDEPLHHVCLMYGLKQTFGKMPFLNRKILKVRGRVVVMDNPVAPPPMMRSPRRKSGILSKHNLVNVSYWKEILHIEYNEDMCTAEEITVFAGTLIQDYLHFRHPFMKTEIVNGQCKDALTAHLVAEIS